VSLETLVQQHPITSESGSALSSAFDADSFDAVVMSTYGRFPSLWNEVQAAAFGIPKDGNISILSQESPHVPWDMLIQQW